ncbi:MAG: hypothetical protein IPM39_10495 [Chloroflexi bacterium]|nr:hypothetical protein [Chloroflexota bacterium]
MPPATAELVFDQLRGFGSYSFAKSHAVAFAVLVYQSAWLKRYHCAAFYTALLNNQPMGFWTPAILVNEARRQGIAVLSVDVAVSQEKCTVAAGRIRLGLGYVKGLSQAQMDAILVRREAAPFADLADFCRRTELGRKAVEALIVAGAQDGWGIARRRCWGNRRCWVCQQASM